jgi:hypothetical protein
MTSTRRAREAVLERSRRLWIPESDADREAVREQLGRILQNVLFRNSRRFPAFLRYTVEHALASAEGLKERTIGHEVFGREPGYDTAQDPAVRMTAAEVRKRLAQYYGSPEHAAELVIAFQPGSYVPEFHVSENATTVSAPPGDPRPTQEGRATRSRLGPRAALFLLVATALASLLATRPSSPRSQTPVSRFWDPLVSSASPILLCVGDPALLGLDPEGNVAPARASGGQLTLPELLRWNSVPYADAVTLALLAGELRARDKPFRIRHPAATEFKDLRDGPVVLIGGLNNPWTLRLTEGRRFALAADHDGSYIRDRDRPESRDWQMGAPAARLADVTRTFGLITRVKDPATGHAAVAVSGLPLGTQAAAECLLDEKCLASAEQMQAGDWQHANLQIVVSSAVIGEDSGAPHVEAVDVW